MVKELPHRKKTMRQNQRMRLRYAHYNSRSPVRVAPQTHVLSFFTNDLPKSLRSAETYLYADDTTIYCIAEAIDLLTNTLNNVLAELLLLLLLPVTELGMVRQKFDGTTKNVKQ